MIISINGSDGSGKSSLINEIMGDQLFNNYIKFPELNFNKTFEEPREFFKWWFINSTCYEFCDVIYALIKSSITDSNLDKNYLIDKGLSTYDARVWATLVIKGKSELASKKIMSYFKKKYSIVDIEDIRILIHPNRQFEEQKLFSNEYSEDEHKIYLQYNLLQKKYLKELENNDYFTKVFANKSTIKKLSTAVKKLILGSVAEPQITCVNISSIEEKNNIYILNKIYKCIKKYFSIKLFVFQGSIGLGNFEKGWSDIDILLVTSPYDFNIKDDLYKKLAEITSIKIGITIFSESEFMNLFVDCKSLYSIYLIRKGVLKPVYLDKNLLIPTVNYNEIVKRNSILLPEYIHNLRRLQITSNLEEVNLKKIIKTSYLIVKIILINKYKVFPKTYKSAIKLFSYFENYTEIDIQNYKEFLIDNTNSILEFSNDLLEFYKSQLEVLKNNQM